MALDTNLMLKASGALTETTTSSSVDFGAGDLNAMTYILNVISVSGSVPTLDVKIQESDDDSTFRDVLTFPQVTAPGQYFVSGRLDGRYRRCVSTIGSATTASFTFSLGPDLAGRYSKY